MINNVPITEFKIIHLFLTENLSSNGGILFAKYYCVSFYLFCMLYNGLTICVVLTIFLENNVFYNNFEIGLFVSCIVF